MKIHALTLAIASLGGALLCIPVTSQAADEAYWYDGSVRRPVWIDRNSNTISPTAPAGSIDPKATGTGARTESERAAKVPTPAASSTNPVNPASLESGKLKRSATVGPKSLDEALPGGVLVSLKEPLKDADARAFLTSQGVTPIRELGQGTGIWLISSPAGEPSLQLANRLYESGQFALAQPNWRSGMQTR